MKEHDPDDPDDPDVSEGNTVERMISTEPREQRRGTWSTPGGMSASCEEMSHGYADGRFFPRRTDGTTRRVTHCPTWSSPTEAEGRHHVN
ncbi:hypothetical protein EYF80_051912 [Liparis tanakae]|uniref:Uncharacterized protein n=1 Tax=Liparis tanakae TaxID=230148 RepID=A0A4Z2FAE1_9TELE|nr:hypothetical protein EYF80_051912 [Liparis tanakae]